MINKKRSGREIANLKRDFVCEIDEGVSRQRFATDQAGDIDQLPCQLTATNRHSWPYGLHPAAGILVRMAETLASLRPTGDVASLRG